MKLWRLVKIGHVWYDEYVSLLIRAESEESARIIAHSFINEDDEQDIAKDWLDPSLVFCQEIEVAGPPEVLMEEYRLG